MKLKDSINWLQVMLQTVENGVLVLLGSLFFPLLPALGAIGNIFTFYVRIAMAQWVCHPPKTRTSAARTSILAYFLMAGERMAMPACLVRLGRWHCLDKKRHVCECKTRNQLGPVLNFIPEVGQVCFLRGTQASC